jgi:hypothetical protein
VEYLQGAQQPVEDVVGREHLYKNCNQSIKIGEKITLSNLNTVSKSSLSNHPVKS